MTQIYLPLLLLLIITIGFVATTLLASHFIGKRTNTSKLKQNAFECGIESMGDARSPFGVKYFLVAILFVLFDVEIVFLYPWAVNFKVLGWTGFYEMLAFTSVVAIGFFYVLRHRVLD